MIIKLSTLDTTLYDLYKHRFEITLDNTGHQANTELIIIDKTDNTEYTRSLGIDVTLFKLENALKE